MEDRDFVINPPSNTLDIRLRNLNNDFEYVKYKFSQDKLRFSTIENGFQYAGYGVAQRDYSQLVSSTSTYLDTFRNMVKVFQEMYPDQWNIEMNLVGDELVIYGISINFDKIRMTNMHGEVHIIRGVVALVPITWGPNRLLLGRLFMGRTKQTEQEFTSSFYHSHIRAGSINTATNHTHEKTPRTFFHDMCLGGSAEGILNRRDSYNTNPVESLLRDYLIHVRSTLRYESLEAGPFRRFGDLNRQSGFNTMRQFNPNNFNNLSVKIAGEFLLKTALQADPNLYFKFDVQNHPLLSKKLIFQDNLKLEQVLIDSFRRLASRVPDKNSRIVIENTTTGRNEESTLQQLSYLFSMTRTINGVERKIHIPVDNFFLPEENEENSDPDTERVVKTYGSGYIFRGNVIPNEVIQAPGTVSQNRRIDSQNEEFRLEPRYLQLIKNQLIQKLTKNVFRKTEETA